MVVENGRSQAVLQIAGAWIAERLSMISISRFTIKQAVRSQCDNAGLPGVESAVKKLFADKKGAGADHHQVVQNKGVLECDDADIRLNQIVEEGSKNGDRQILYIYGGKPQKDQYREDRQIASAKTEIRIALFPEQRRYA